MKVFGDLLGAPPASPEYPVVTVGVFDGLHLGHQAIVSRALAAAGGQPVAVVTFDPHPRAVLGPPKPHRLLSPIEERIQLLSAWPLAAVAIVRFDASVARMSYGDFVTRALVQGLGGRTLVLGYNLHLGHQRQGTPERLVELGSEMGYRVELVPPVEVDGGPVSSTRVRRHLDAGEVEAAARLLGRPYALRGTVVRGAGRGRTLGVPTANLELANEKLVPANGVYAVWARFGARRLPGALNIGVVPTFQDEGKQSVEVHLLGFEGDLYGERVELELVERLRAERRFADPGQLRAQIDLDLEAVRTHLGSASS